MIRIKNLTRTYGDFIAVDRVSFEISHGEIVGLLGHNGAGKTTIMKMITGFLEPSDGSIEIDGMSLSDNLQEIQRGIGYLPENCPVYPEMTVLDYLDYAASLHGVSAQERSARVLEAINRTDLSPKATQVVATLSRGYRQRVGVAQAILHHPNILILDEPTNGLDPTQIQHMRALVKTLAKSATVIISTHILQEVQAVCDRVIIIRNGQVALDSKIAELRHGDRLLVTTDGMVEPVSRLFSGLAQISSVKKIESQHQKQRYALTLTDATSFDETAAQVARLVLDQGWKLYDLRPEMLDLESVFGEISIASGRMEI